MTPEEARAQSLDIMARVLGLDEFQRIAVADLSAEIDAAGGLEAWTPGSRVELLLGYLGAIASEAIGFPRPPLDDHEGEA